MEHWERGQRVEAKDGVLEQLNIGLVDHAVIIKVEVSTGHGGVGAGGWDENIPARGNARASGKELDKTLEIDDGGAVVRIQIAEQQRCLGTGGG